MTLSLSLALALGKRERERGRRTRTAAEEEEPRPRGSGSGAGSRSRCHFRGLGGPPDRLVSAVIFCGFFLGFLELFAGRGRGLGVGGRFEEGPCGFEAISAEIPWEAGGFWFCAG